MCERLKSIRGRGAEPLFHFAFSLHRLMHHEIFALIEGRDDKRERERHRAHTPAIIIYYSHHTCPSTDVLRNLASLALMI
jgi:hypothetical protein